MTYVNCTTCDHTYQNLNYTDCPRCNLPEEVKVEENSKRKQGWYAEDENIQRWFNGREWTDRRRANIEANVVAGWYPNPKRPKETIWFNGTDWIEGPNASNSQDNTIMLMIASIIALISLPIILFVIMLLVALGNEHN